MSKKRVRRAEKTFVVCTRATAPVRAWLKKEAKRERKTLARFVSEIIMLYFETNQPQEVAA